MRLCSDFPSAVWKRATEHFQWCCCCNDFENSTQSYQRLQVETFTGLLKTFLLTRYNSAPRTLGVPTGDALFKYIQRHRHLEFLPFVTLIQPQATLLSKCSVIQTKRQSRRRCSIHCRRFLFAAWQHVSTKTNWSSFVRWARACSLFGCLEDRDSRYCADFQYIPIVASDLTCSAIGLLRCSHKYFICKYAHIYL